ncbi:hypothetical protein C8T65DRAFT_587400, partial [Cerioporus squamosus]
DGRERLFTLLDADFHDTGFEGTYVTAPSQMCPHCVKESEFLDWVYVALERSMHSPGFIFDSPKASRTPKSTLWTTMCTAPAAAT